MKKSTRAITSVLLLILFLSPLFIISDYIFDYKFLYNKYEVYDVKEFFYVENKDNGTEIKKVKVSFKFVNRDGNTVNVDDQTSRESLGAGCGCDNSNDFDIPTHERESNMVYNSVIKDNILYERWFVLRGFFLAILLVFNMMAIGALSEDYLFYCTGKGVRTCYCCNCPIYYICVKRYKHTTSLKYKIKQFFLIN